MFFSRCLPKAIARKCASAVCLVFLNSFFSYCKRAKELFSGLNVVFGDVELDKVENGDAIQDELANMTGQRTVPNIFINGKHVGGCDAVHKLHEEGNLLPKVNEQK